MTRFSDPSVHPVEALKNVRRAGDSCIHLPFGALFVLCSTEMP